MDGRLKAMVTLLRRTMAPVCPLSLSRWETRPIIGTDRPTKGFRTAPRPCWSKRNQHLGIASVIMPTVGDKLSEPEKCARGPGMHRAGRGHHSGHSDDHLAHRFDATSSITSPRWLKRRQNQGQLAGSQSDVQRRLRLQPLVCERPLYSLCTCVTRIRAVLPRTRTGSVGVTSRWQTADVRCSERPLRLQQSRGTSSERSQRTYIFCMYPYPSYGAAEPISGGLQGR